jgi:hypothetical protein
LTEALKSWLANLIQTLQTALADLIKISGGGTVDPPPRPPVVPPVTHPSVGRTYDVGNVGEYLNLPYQLETPCTVRFVCDQPTKLSWVSDVNTYQKQGRMVMVVDGQTMSYGYPSNYSFQAGAHAISFSPDPAYGYVAFWTVFRRA